MFARVNETRGVNEISITKFLDPLIQCICLVFFAQNISAIVNEMTNFKRSNFASVQLTASIT